MSSRRLFAIASLFVLASSALPAKAATRLDVDQSSGVFTFDCGGRDVYVSGSSDTIVLRGACGALHVSGSSNAIRGGSFTAIVISGTSNDVSYGGAKVAVDNTGNANDVVNRNPGAASDVTGSVDNAVSAALGAAGVAAAQDATGGASDAMLIDGISRHGEYDCTGKKSFTINGTDNVVRLHGACDRVTVNGVDNRVTFDTARRLGVSGTGNIVRWTGAKPAAIDQSGIDNTVGAAP